MYIALQTDYNCKTNFWGDHGTTTGLIYTVDEIIAIRTKLKDIISKICVPPQGIQDREKIIYAQIVQHLSEIVQYDYEGAKLIDEHKEIYYYDSEEEEERADKTQNLKGLLEEDNQTVCKGMSTIINALTKYFGISSQSIANDDHAWNLVTLDGETYEDDFTWYLDNLKARAIPRIQTFLNGSIDGKRAFGTLKHHHTDEDLQLSEGISTTEKINLLATDWSKVQDWETVNIRKTNALDTFMNQLEDFAKKVRITLKEKINERFRLIPKKEGNEDGSR